MATFVLVSVGSAQMKEGLWEITSKGEIQGMPAQMPATTIKQCITKQNAVPKPEGPSRDQDCVIKDQKIIGDTVTYTMECKDKAGTNVQISGQMAFKGNSFDGTSNTTIKSKEMGTMQMTGKMSGKYVGPCPK
jgi:hypothetical protein